MQAASRFARHLQVGHIAGPEITLRAPALRSISLDLRGFSIAHPPAALRRRGFLDLTRHVAQGDIAVAHEAVPLADVGRAWARQRRAEGGPKLVLVP
jgi:hypothetical protein